MVALICLILCPVFAYGQKPHSAEEKRQRTTLNRHGVPLLQGPLKPGGPTMGEGSLADFWGTDSGWWYKKDNPSARYIFARVKNNSKYTWKNVVVRFSIFDKNRRFLRFETGPFPPPGRFRPGSQQYQKWGPVGPQDYVFKIIGFTGEREKA